MPPIVEVLNSKFESEVGNNICLLISLPVLNCILVAVLLSYPCKVNIPSVVVLFTFNPVNVPVVPINPPVNVPPVKGK